MRNQYNKIIETDNWTRLFIFNDKIYFYFLNMFLYITLCRIPVVYCRTSLHFKSSLFNNLRKTNSENISTPKVGVVNIEFTLKIRIHRSLKSFICLKWIRKKFSTTLSVPFLYHIRLSPIFNTKISIILEKSSIFYKKKFSIRFINLWLILFKFSYLSPKS